MVIKTGGADILSASLEDYLKGIFHIIAEKQAARAKDISERLNVNSSSVTGALHALAKRELINYEPYDIITLTEKGKMVAEDVIRRHDALRDFFVKVLQVDEIVAEEGACKMEHAVPTPILDRLIKFVQFVEVCPRAGTEWIKESRYYCQHGKARENCEMCISLCLEALRKGKIGGKD
nr:metal-dependent transcriptional regulator [Desulfobacterales bacterium]